MTTEDTPEQDDVGDVGDEGDVGDVGDKADGADAVVVDGVVVDDAVLQLTERALQALEQVQQVASTSWRELPGREGSLVPVDEAGLQAMQDAVSRARAEAGEEPGMDVALAAFERTVTWSRSPTFIGSWAAPLGALVLGGFALLQGWRGDAAPLQAAGLFWIAGGMLYPNAAVRPQVEVNAAVVSGSKSLDDRFLAIVAAGAPIMAPVLMFVRLLVFGLLAPSLTGWHAARPPRSPAGFALLVVGGALAAWVLLAGG